MSFVNGEAKTVLELDLVSYSDVARILEDHLDVYAVKAFQDQIQSFVDEGLQLLGLRRDDVVFGTAGDNALLFFNDAATAHRFSEAVHRVSANHNSKRAAESAKRWFRIGAATGPVLVLPAERRVVGTTVTRAVRLEAAALRGELVIDAATFDALPDELKTAYGAEEVISGKRDERYSARRCVFIQGIADLDSVAGERPPAVASPPVRVTVHLAEFEVSGTACCFINVTNVSRDADVELTHVWIEATAQIFAHNPDRLLPKRLRPRESWETWLPVNRLVGSGLDDTTVYHAARVRVSTGEVVASVRNTTVPLEGTVPGGPIESPP
ncbi:nucleotidyl cyclase domain-containing protein [Limnoglobus roseus]|uniref:Adenylate/guanylate cyclase domain-containing protein n=1 Tax=Limnoglobus roseus TaxID=2598579 RepID=A0A5C1AL30_9BACT|nr:hypothetical protein [Limnoglobus roseus]QEL17598.1 hypothetical protein PX52LOC_04594 [Limnoglobus roseus]